jgi:hypothetical protein
MVLDGVIQFLVYELRRIPIPRTPVNRPLQNVIGTFVV